MLGLLLCAVAATAPSPSKLSVHLLGGTYSPGARQIVAAWPRLLKVFDVGPDTVEALRDFKTRNPQGLTTLRVWFQRRWTREQNPEASADEMWAEVLKPKLDQLPPDARRRVDFLEGPNEGDSTPTWESVENAAWYGRFSARLADRIGRAGYRPVVGNIAVGNPGGTPEEMRAKIAAFLPALEAAHRHRGAWAYHSYTLDITEDVEKEQWHSLRYRLIHREIVSLRPSLATMPLLLNEGGIDRGGNREKDGWAARVSGEAYLDWLRWFDARMQEDDYVVGLTIFQIGDSWWSSFNVEPLAGELAKLISGR